MLGLDPGLEQRDERGGHQPGDGDGSEHSPSPPVERPASETTEHDDGEDPRPDHDDVDDPRRDGVEATEEIGCEPDQGVAEHLLDEEDDEHRAAAMTRRRTSAGDRSTVWRGRRRALTAPNVGDVIPFDAFPVTPSVRVLAPLARLAHVPIEITESGAPRSIRRRTNLPSSARTR